VKAIILAAGVGKRFGKRTSATPKCLIPLGGTTLLARYFKALRQNRISQAVIVVGHRAAKIRRACHSLATGIRLRFVTNRRYRRGSVLSLRAAARHLKGDAVIMDADVYFPPESLSKLLAKTDSAFLYDPRSKSAGEEMMVMAKAGRPWALSKKVDASLKVLGEATGIFKLGAAHAALLRASLDELYRRGLHDVEYEEAYSSLCKKTRVGIVSIGEVFWSEMDFEKDWRRISTHLKSQSQALSRRDRPVKTASR